jgi:hypothetical protein
MLLFILPAVKLRPQKHSALMVWGRRLLRAFSVWNLFGNRNYLSSLFGRERPKELKINDEHGFFFVAV